MNESNLDNLNKLTRLLGADRLFSAEDVEKIKEVLIGVLANNKREVEGLTEETKQAVESLLNKVEFEHNTYLKNTEKMAQEVKSDTTEAMQKAMQEFEMVKKMCKEVMDCKPEDGKDANEEMIIEEVLAKIKLPEYKEIVLDDGGQIVDKINSLPVNEENQIDAKHIKNLPEIKSVRGVGGGVTQKKVLQLIQESGGAGVTLKVGGTNNIDQGTLDLIAGSGITIVDNGDGTVTFAATGGGGSGSPGGSTTQLQYNNAGAFGGISGATTNGTAVTYTTGNLIGADVKASGSGGLALKSNNGTTTSLHGAGGGANNTFYGDVKLDYATATTVPYIDASKNLISSSVTPTELGYLSGVTSAIQTQLDAKEPTITTLAVNKGGTGQTTYINGQLLIGNTTGNTLTKATLTGTSNQVVVTNGGGSITLSTPQDIGSWSCKGW
jgi:hypothetical protein